MAFSAAIIDSLRVKGIKSCSKSLSLNRWKRPAVAAEVAAAAAAPGDIPAAAAVTDAAAVGDVAVGSTGVASVEDSFGATDNDAEDEEDVAEAGNDGKNDCAKDDEKDVAGNVEDDADNVGNEEEEEDEEEGGEVEGKSG